MADSRDITGKNRKFTGTTGIKLPTGTTGERVDEAGQIRFNSSTNLAEYYDGTDWKSIDAPPTISGFTLDGGSSVTSTIIDNTAGGDATIVISGSNFDTTSATVVFEPEGGGSDVSVQTITRTNSSSFTVTVTRADFLEANDPYAIKLTNGSGLAATLASALDVNVAPTFATAADTNIGTVENGQTDFSGLTTVAATDADGDTITHTISAGTLPSGMSLQTDGTFTGTVASQGALTEYTFTVQAATTNATITRQFKVNGVDSLFVAATGGTITTSGDFKIHKFTSPGTFTVTGAGTSGGSNSVEYLVVAGGGGGGGAGQVNTAGGGGGAGGYRTNFPSPAIGGFPVSATSYPISVGGAGAAGGPGLGSPGSRGGNSVFSTITSTGGGGGNSYSGGSQPQVPGGSGGGAESFANPGPASVGVGNTPPVSPSQGRPGGTGAAVPQNPPVAGGGGGGIAAAGGNAGPGSGGAGGGGNTSTISGSPVVYSAGGGGAGNSPGPGGNPGAGNGAAGPTANGSSAPGTNRGMGGGGAQTGPSGNNTGGNGSSGVVILRYKFQ